MGNEQGRLRDEGNEISPEENNNDKNRKEMYINKMDSIIRKRIRGGITYNMKILIRGATGTGKTSLLERLKGCPIPKLHVKTKQINTATINWHKNENLEDNVRVEIWDVVDNQLNNDNNNKEPDIENSIGNKILHNDKNNNKNNLASNSLHLNLPVDASSIDVYKDANCIIFIMDITKWETYEYVKRHLEYVPIHIPTLILGSFRDLGENRKIQKEDIEQLFHNDINTSNNNNKTSSRPYDIQYFECSLKDCFGLNILHQYLRIPFLNLKLNTLRQQLKSSEGQLSSAKHDIEVKITNQKYSNYVEYIKLTKSDIITGKINHKQLNIEEENKENELVIKTLEKNNISIQSDQEKKTESPLIIHSNSTNGTNKLIHKDNHINELKTNDMKLDKKKDKKHIIKTNLNDSTISKNNESIDDFKVSVNNHSGFYSSDEDDSDNDKDVIVPMSSVNISNTRKNGFIHSDSDSDPSDNL